jgi:hypothetical protein
VVAGLASSSLVDRPLERCSAEGDATVIRGDAHRFDPCSPPASEGGVKQEARLQAPVHVSVVRLERHHLVVGVGLDGVEGHPATMVQRHRPR